MILLPNQKRTGEEVPLDLRLECQQTGRGNAHTLR